MFICRAEQHFFYGESFFFGKLGNCKKSSYNIIMLVLTRKSGEAITIGEDIHVKVISIKGGQVRIGIDAPRDVNVNREEVLLEIQSTEAAVAES